MFLVCESWVGDSGRTALLTQLLLLTIARCVIFKNPLSTSSASWLELLRAIALGGVFSVFKLAGVPVTNWLNGHRQLPIFFHNVHLLPLLLPHIYTGASLVDGSVKGQYITIILNWFKYCYRRQKILFNIHLFLH